MPDCKWAEAPSRPKNRLDPSCTYCQVVWRRWLCFLCNVRYF